MTWLAPNDMVVKMENQTCMMGVKFMRRISAKPLAGEEVDSV